MGTSSPAFDDLLRDAAEIARRAGDAIMDIYRDGDLGTQVKADASPLTRADLASHRLILDALGALTPEIPALSEESTTIPYDARAAWSTYWLIDPLDGTKEFIERNGEFTVNIALLQGGRPVLGVVHAPAIAATYAAAQGVGAFRRTGAGEPVSIRVRPYAGGTVKIVASRSHAGPALARFLDSVGDYECASMGSSLKLCLIADGSAHLYPRLGPTCEWDIAAGHAIVSEAGGAVWDLNGAPIRYNKPDPLNPFFIATGVPEYPWRDHLAGVTG
jgi:3'(2'), 5'-bisphosphate nucleotidase